MDIRPVRLDPVPRETLQFDVAAASFWGPYVAVLVIGVLLGVLMTVLVYGLVRSGARRRLLRREERARLRRAKAAVRAPLPQLWNPGPAVTSAGPQSRHPATGSINDYLEGRRQRPDFNPQAGPRDW